MSRTRPRRLAWELEFYRRLGAKIKRARRARGLDGAALARLIGTSTATLWHWEEGDRGMGAARLQRIADALGMTATALLPELGDLSIDA